jgi:hypothetical protein
MCRRPVKTKLTEAEKLRRKVERKRKALQASQLAEVGGPNSLFRDLAETVTTADAEWHIRRTAARTAEHNANSPIGIKMLWAIRLWSIETEARRLLGGDWFERLAGYARSTFPDMLTYGYGFWRGVLTGEKRTVFAMERVDDPAAKGGVRVVETDSFPPAAWVPVMTRDEFHRRWPVADMPLGPEPAESVELFETVMAAIKVLSSQRPS